MCFPKTDPIFQQQPHLVSSKAILKPIGTIFQQSVTFLKLLETFFCENFPTKQTAVCTLEIFKQQNFFAKISQLSKVL